MNAFLPLSVRRFLIGGLLLGLSFAAPVARAGEKVDYSHYDVPLYDQLIEHMKDKISARLGEGKSTHDRYFIVPFAYQDRGNHPEFSHSFMSVIHVWPDGVKRAKPIAGLKVRKYKNREFESFTISWLPADFDKNPDLCVFDGFGSRLVPSWNRCETSVGRSFRLDETIKLAVAVKNAVCMWGPYEITKGAFDLGVKRMNLLNSGAIKYRADDRLTRKDRTAINCFHAMANVYELYPNGGIFGTGFRMWGLNGTARVLIEYKDRAGKKGLLLEPVDEKKDRFGFVYSPARGNQRVYNPFKSAMAYHR